MITACCCPFSVSASYSYDWYLYRAEYNTYYTCLKMSTPSAQPIFVVSFTSIHLYKYIPLPVIDFFPQSRTARPNHYHTSEFLFHGRSGSCCQNTCSNGYPRQSSPTISKLFCNVYIARVQLPLHLITFFIYFKLAP